MSENKKKQKRLSGRLAIFITILLFVCTIIFLNHQFTSGSLRRFSYWIFKGVKGDATESSIVYDANEYNSFLRLKGNLCVVSPDDISVYKVSGTPTLSEPVLLRSPAVASSESRFVAYDLGGLNFYVANTKKILYSGVSESKILNLNINNFGDFTITSDGTDCKSLVTVYNSEFEQIYKFYSSEQYVFDAAVSQNAKELAVLSYAAVDGNFSSSLSLCKTNEDKFFAVINLGDSMPLKASYYTEDKLAVICNDRTLIYKTDGTFISEINYDGLPLESYAESYGNRIVISLDNYQNSGNSKLLFIDTEGKKVREHSFDDDIYSISCSGKYTSVQFTNKCIIYKDPSTIHHEFEISPSVTKCIVSNDSSVISIGENSATVFVI